MMEKQWKEKHRIEKRNTITADMTKFPGWKHRQKTQFPMDFVIVSPLYANNSFFRIHSLHIVKDTVSVYQWCSMWIESDGQPTSQNTQSFIEHFCSIFSKLFKILHTRRQWRSWYSTTKMIFYSCIVDEAHNLLVSNRFIRIAFHVGQFWMVLVSMLMCLWNKGVHFYWWYFYR